MKSIHSLRISHGMTLEELGNKVGVGKSTVRKWETGMITSIRSDKIEKIAAALDTTPAYLLGWPREMDELDGIVHDSYPDFVPGKGYIAEKRPSNLLPIHARKVPILGGIAAGEPIYAQEEHEEYADVDEDTPCDYALRVEGDSMEPTICLGDLVFIRRQSDVNDGRDRRRPHRGQCHPETHLPPVRQPDPHFRQRRQISPPPHHPRGRRSPHSGPGRVV